MTNHFFIRLSSVCIAIAMLVLLPTMLLAQGKVASTQPGTSQININTANESQLTTLPGIGPTIAERIIRHRQEIGPFKTTEDLKQVKGVGDKIFIKIKHLITTDSPS